MLNKIYQWLVKYDFEISWFFIGYFTSEFFQDFARGNWVGVILDIVIIVLNYTMVQGRK
jgi:hypothetical protein